MKNHINCILLLIVFICSSSLEAKIINTVKIQVQDFQKDTTRFIFNCHYLLHITQTLRFEGKVDTVHLSLKHPTRAANISFLCFQDIKLKTEEGISINYESGSSDLRFALPEGSRSVVLDFLFQSDYVLTGNPDIIGVSSFVQEHDQSWCFTSPDMYTDSITAIVPPYLYFFPDIPFSKKNDSLYTVSLGDSLSTISFYLYDKYYYHEHAFFENGVDVTLCLFKGVRINKGYSDEEYFMMDRKDIYLVEDWVNEDRIHRVEKSIRFIIDRLPLIFPPRESKWKIVESLMGISFRTEEQLRWARALLLSPSHAIFLIDTVDYGSQMLIHEITHLYNDILPSKEDSSYYFFHEALTDYIARFLLYTEAGERDSVFMSLWEEYDKDTLKEDISIFKVKKIYANAEGGTYKITYKKIPFLIHCFAKEIGEKRFVKILAEFFRQISDTKKVNMEVLEKCCKKNGVSHKQWEKFMGQISNNYQYKK